MIERFTEEELEIIKKELRLQNKQGNKGNKKNILNKQYRKIMSIFPNDCEERKNRMIPVKDVWNSLLVICDYSLKNYDKFSKNKFKNPCWKRQKTVLNPKEYEKLLDELIAIIERYR